VVAEGNWSVCGSVPGSVVVVVESAIVVDPDEADAVAVGSPGVSRAAARPDGGWPG
jgi:hypothetical protein